MLDLWYTAQDSKLGEQMHEKKFRWKLKNGNSVMLWEDVWYQNCALKSKFAKLYKLTLQHLEDSMFIDIWECYVHTGEAFSIRELRGWEVEEVRELESVLKTVNLNSKSDELIWKTEIALFSTD